MNSADEVLPNLFIGSYDDACDSSFLDSVKISHILTVASDLPPKYPTQFQYLIIEALDLDTQDLYPAFAQSFEFIENALSNNGKVLVHCLYGISRSSTIIISYLMKKLKIRYEEAFKILKEKHPRADPNGGFVRQLMKLESIMFGTSLPFLCRCCRGELFAIGDLVQHSSEKSKRFRKGQFGEEECKSLFISKMDWMGECSEMSGRIDCLYCLSKLGNYNWSGRQCSCGKFVTPAFQISRSAVDGQISHEGYISQPKKWT